MKDIIIVMIFFSLFTNTRYLDGRCMGQLGVLREGAGGGGGFDLGKR